jgi:hypothetical protein
MLAAALQTKIHGGALVLIGCISPPPCTSVLTMVTSHVLYQLQQNTSSFF